MQHNYSALYSEIHLIQDAHLSSQCLSVKYLTEQRCVGSKHTERLNLVGSGGIRELDIFEVESSTDCTQCEATCLETGLSVNSDVLEHS